MPKQFIVFIAIYFLALSASALYFIPKPAHQITPPPTIRQTSVPTPTPTPIPTPPPRLVHEVPFTSQAPLAEWSDPLQQDGCEEASVLMAVSWAKNQPLDPPASNKQKILAIANWQQANYGSAIDTSASDTLDRLIYAYFQYPHASTQAISDPQPIITALALGHLVIAPMDGQKLPNPHFTPPGPERHMLVIIGYDLTKNIFITHDPGTRFGASYHYDIQILFQSIRDYPTGNHQPLIDMPKTIIIVEKIPPGPSPKLD